jgi:hypothetical protein
MARIVLTPMPERLASVFLVEAGERVRPPFIWFPKNKQGQMIPRFRAAVWRFLDIEPWHAVIATTRPAIYAGLSKAKITKAFAISPGGILPA